MRAVFHFFKLIRFPNLLIIIFTQYAMRYGIIDAMLKRLNFEVNNLLPGMLKLEVFELQLSDFNFFLLSLSTVMIAAAGYIINDYFDLKIDRINKPDKIIIIRHIKRRVAMGAHILINTLAALIGIYLCYKLGLLKLSLIFIVVPAGLWYYSIKFKRQVFIGNIIISLFTALIPLIVILFELPLLAKKYNSIIAPFGINFNSIFYFVLAFSFFAFMINFIREIIKDIEDIEGDKAYACNTIPIVYGIDKAKYFAIALLLISIISMGYLQVTFWKIQELISFYYILILLELPMLFLIYRIHKSESKKDFKLISMILKIIMLMGIAYSGVIYYNFAINI